MDDKKAMRAAIEQAHLAIEADEVPIGCVIIKDDEILSSAHNHRETQQRSVAHAEILAIDEACRKLNTWRLEDCTLYVTLEPCPMCAGAIIQSRIKRVVYGARDPKGGSVESCVRLFDIQQYNHHPLYEGGVLEDECSGLLKDFFRQKRKKDRKSESEG